MSVTLFVVELANFSWFYPLKSVPKELVARRSQFLKSQNCWLKLWLIHVDTCWYMLIPLKHPRYPRKMWKHDSPRLGGASESPGEAAAAAGSARDSGGDAAEAHGVAGCIRWPKWWESPRKMGKMGDDHDGKIWKNGPEIQNKDSWRSENMWTLMFSWSRAMDNSLLFFCIDFEWDLYTGFLLLCWFTRG